MSATRGPAKAALVLPSAETHDRVGDLGAARSSCAVVVGPGNLQIVSPPCLGLPANSQSDIDRREVGKGDRSRRTEKLVTEGAVTGVGACGELKGMVCLENFVDAVPLQASDVEDTGQFCRVASEAHAEEVETQARVLA